MLLNFVILCFTFRIIHYFVRTADDVTFLQTEKKAINSLENTTLYMRNIHEKYSQRFAYYSSSGVKVVRGAIVER